MAALLVRGLWQLRRRRAECGSIGATLTCRKPDDRRHPGFTGRVLNVQWLGWQPCLELCGPRSSGWQPRGPFSLLLLQKLDRIGRSPLNCGAIAANDDPRVQMGASALIKHPPTPSRTTGTRILSYLYTEFLWFSHGSDLKRPWRQGKARNCHEPVMLWD